MLVYNLAEDHVNERVDTTFKAKGFDVTCHNTNCMQISKENLDVTMEYIF